MSGVFHILVISATVFATLFTAVMVHAEPTKSSDLVCKVAEVKYQTCLDEGVLRYARSALGEGDFSYLVECKRKRDEENVRCGLAKGLNKKQAKEHSAFLSSRIEKQDVETLRRHGCTPVLDNNGNILEDPNLAGSGKAICPSGIGGGFSCVKRWNNDGYECIATIRVLSAIANNR